MKVTKAKEPVKVSSENTKVGELYIFDGTGQVYFRHATGLANLETGANQPLNTAVGGDRFIHQPNAELVLL